MEGPELPFASPEDTQGCQGIAAVNAKHPSQVFPGKVRQGSSLLKPMGTRKDERRKPEKIRLKFYMFEK